MIELVAFLGNPGGEYEGNRHNAGWLLARRLPFFPALNWQRKFKGRYASLESAALRPMPAEEPEAPARRIPPDTPQGPDRAGLPEKIHLLMPETYMNRSGDSVRAAASFFKIPPEHILVVHDELELPLGSAALKFSGGLGGHNGLRSMKAAFGTADFWRLRIGIGRPDHDDISAWVLSDFSPPEEPVLEQVLAVSAEALVRSLLSGPDSLLPEWHKKKIL
ncbi:MAG: aminoacyl-tRNA hydrolase [Treponema sp.]|jgi:PTH1 family peptidyl-tRNA hydrolase|nr:aminoacyl-tRNA hydrolase [Treponema sp.]